MFCRPCKAIAPQLEELASQFSDVLFVKVDVDKSQELTDKYEVSAMPTFKFVKNKEVVETVRGADASAILEAIKAHKTVLQTIAFGGGGSVAAADGNEPLSLTFQQIAAVENFVQVAEMATHEQAAAALAANKWDLQGAAQAFFADVANARWQAVCSVSGAIGTPPSDAAAPEGGEVKLQVRLGLDGRDKHMIAMPNSATGKELLLRLATLLPADEEFTVKLRVAVAKADFAVGPADMAAPLSALGLARRGLVHLIPLNDDPERVKVLKKL
jgi:thiol-disulfide isomerase/thioredoxin